MRPLNYGGILRGEGIIVAALEHDAHVDVCLTETRAFSSDAVALDGW
jgi:hypothetical protein